MVQNLLIRMLTTLAPLIHKGIVDRLANSPTFQRVAWEGTEAAKAAAKRGLDRAKAAGILEEVTPQMRAQAAKAAKDAPGPIERLIRRLM